jgi:hypothetical protein
MIEFVGAIVYHTIINCVMFFGACDWLKSTDGRSEEIQDDRSQERNQFQKLKKSLSTGSGHLCGAAGVRRQDRARFQYHYFGTLY